VVACLACLAAVPAWRAAWSVPTVAYGRAVRSGARELGRAGSPPRTRAACASSAAPLAPLALTALGSCASRPRRLPTWSHPSLAANRMSARQQCDRHVGSQRVRGARRSRCFAPCLHPRTSVPGSTRLRAARLDPRQRSFVLASARPRRAAVRSRPTRSRPLGSERRRAAREPVASPCDANRRRPRRSARGLSGLDGLENAAHRLLGLRVQHVPRGELARLRIARLPDARGSAL
jgi:hypothetical protein